MKATYDMATLATETSTQEVVAEWGSTTLYVKDAEDRDAVAEREALERVSIAEPENATMLASTCDVAEGFAQKIALLEDQLAVERRAQEVSESER
jgi:hypothetical protein